MRSLRCNFPVTPHARERQTHVFCVGLPRSGTHTIGFMFGEVLRTAHEPETLDTIIHVLRWGNGEYSRQRMLRLLVHRDNRLNLHLEASHYLHHVTDLLVELFPDAKFVLTVRDPMSWLASEINKNYGSRNKNMWKNLERYRYGKYPYEHEFHQLRGIGNVYPIRSYLSYWKEHVHKVISQVPTHRLLIVETHGIFEHSASIASFIGTNHVPDDSPCTGERNPKIDLYDLVEANEVKKLVEAFCGDFIKANLPQLSETP